MLTRRALRRGDFRSKVKDYADGKEAERSLGKFFKFYCEMRPHSSLGMRTPAEVYTEGRSE